MRYWLKAAVAVLSISFLAGCPDTTGPTDELEADFEFGINRLQTEPAFVVNAGTGEITIRGYFETACSGYTATARAYLTENRIALHVHGRQPDGCRQMMSAVGYQATLRGIPGGTYDVTASHAYPVNNATTLTLVGSQVVVR